MLLGFVARKNKHAAKALPHAIFRRWVPALLISEFVEFYTLLYFEVAGKVS
jgi:hypothetical protein